MSWSIDNTVTLKSDSHLMFGQIALAGSLAEDSMCTEIRAVESSTGSFVVCGWQSQSKTGDLNMTCTSGPLLPLAEHLTT